MNAVNFQTICVLAVICTLLILAMIVVMPTHHTQSHKHHREGFEDKESLDLTKRPYNSYSDMVLQESIANRAKYLEEIKNRDVAESYPWIAIDDVWSQPTLFPGRLLHPGKGEEPWNRRQQWVPRERKYGDFMDVVYVGNPLPQ